MLGPPRRAVAIYYDYHRHLASIAFRRRHALPPRHPQFPGFPSSKLPRARRRRHAAMPVYRIVHGLYHTPPSFRRRISGGDRTGFFISIYLCSPGFARLSRRRRAALPAGRVDAAAPFNVYTVPRASATTRPHAELYDASAWRSSNCRCASRLRAAIPFRRDSTVTLISMRR